MEESKLNATLEVGMMTGGNVVLNHLAGFAK